MKDLVQQENLLEHLKGLAAASMLVVSMTTPVFEIASTVKSAYEMAYIVENYGQYLGQGPYMIESKDDHQWKEQPFPDPVISGYAFAFTICATLARSGRPIGGYRSLVKGLSDFEYLAMTEMSPRTMVATLLVKLPNDPEELRRLRLLLDETTFMYSIDDGSGFFHEGNTKLGNGIPLA